MVSTQDVMASMRFLKKVGVVVADMAETDFLSQESTIYHKLQRVPKVCWNRSDLGSAK